MKMSSFLPGLQKYVHAKINLLKVTYSEYLVFKIYSIYKQITKMQDPNADTEWNDALRKHGILPEKKKEAEVTEDDILKMMDATIKAKTGQKDLNVSFFLSLLFNSCNSVS